MRTLIINAGGESARLKDVFALPLGKSWLEVQNKPILIRNIEHFLSEVAEIVIIVQNASFISLFEKELAKYGYYQADIEKVRIISEDSDSIPSGPNRGICTGIQSAQNEILWFMPCDHPFVSPNMFKTLEDYLTDQNIVSLHNGPFMFEPQLFVSYHHTLVQFIPYLSDLPIDLYRLIPKSVFIPANNKESKLALLGINSVIELANLSKRIKKIQDGAFKTDLQLQKMNRVTISLPSLENRLELTLIQELYDQGHFYLLERLFELYQYAKPPIPLKDLYFQEWQQWQDVCPLIAFHCAVKLLRVKLDSKTYLKVNEFVTDWKKRFGK
ncbi:MAG: molybdenum cofactor guanylyltransferase [Promethearchaeota archaeon]